MLFPGRLLGPTKLACFIIKHSKLTLPESLFPRWERGMPRAAKTSWNPKSDWSSLGGRPQRPPHGRVRRAWDHKSLSAFWVTKLTFWIFIYWWRSTTNPIKWLFVNAVHFWRNPLFFCSTHHASLSISVSPRGPFCFVLPEIVQCFSSFDFDV